MKFTFFFLLSLIAVNVLAGSGIPPGPPNPNPATQSLSFNPTGNKVVITWSKDSSKVINGERRVISEFKQLSDGELASNAYSALELTGSLILRGLQPGFYNFCHMTFHPDYKPTDLFGTASSCTLDKKKDNTLFIPDNNFKPKIVLGDEIESRDFDGRIWVEYIKELKAKEIDRKITLVNLVKGTEVIMTKPKSFFKDLESGDYQAKAIVCPNKSINGYCSEEAISSILTVERTPIPSEIGVSNFSASTANIEIGGSIFAFNSINPRYIVSSRSKGSDDQWTNWVANNVIHIPMADVAKAETKQVEISGLANNRDYEVKVQTCNSSCSETVASNLIEVRYPSNNLSVGPVSGYGSYNLTWTPSNIDKDPIYILKETRQSNGAIKLMEFTDLDNTKLVAMQKINNDVYQYQLNACYVISGKRSCTGYSPVVEAVVNVQLDTPRLSTLTVNSSGSVTLNWEAVNGVSGYPTYYKIYNDDNLQLHTTTANQLSWIYNVQDNGDYTFQVQACSYDHCSPKSVARTVSVSVSPDSPALSKINASQSGFEISWSQANRADSYVLQHKLDSGDWQSVALTAQQTSDRRYSVSLPSSSVAQGKHYYQVKACDSSFNKCSGFSNTVNHTVNYTPLNGALDVDRANSQCDSLITNKCFTRISNITLVWDKDTSGLVHYYEIFESEGAMPIHVENITQASHLNTANIAGLETGTYSFKYRSCSNFNTKACSEFSQTTQVQVGLPTPVTEKPVIASYVDNTQTNLVTGPYSIKWNRVSNADIYDVYSKLHSSEEWKKVATITDSESQNGLLTYNYDPSDLMSWGEHSYYVNARNGDNGAQHPAPQSSILTVTVELDETIALRKKLYYPEADNIDEDRPNYRQFARDKAAFRYLDLMYQFNSDAQVVVSTYFNGDGAVETPRDFTELYDTAERTRIDGVLAQLSENLRNAYDEILLNEPNAVTRFTRSKKLLLDVFYDRAVAEMVLANQDLDKSRISRLREEGIWSELNSLNNAHDHFYQALSDYTHLFMQNKFDYPNLIEEQLASRKQNSPRYWQEGYSEPESVVDETSANLLKEYKDLVLYFDLVAKTFDTKIQSIKLQVHDVTTTQIELDLIKQDLLSLKLEIINWTSHLQSKLPNTIFSAIDSIEVKKAIDRYNQALDSIEIAINWIDGETNVLGLGDDALIIVSGGYGVDGSLTYNSYDAIVGLLVGSGSKKGYLTIAKEDFANAISSYENYRHNQDKLASEYNDRNVQLNNTLTNLIGWTVSDGCYDDCVVQNPDDVIGSEISIQIKRIKQAQIDIESAALRLENLEIDIKEMVRVEQVRTNINGLINTTILDYGEQQASISQKIGKIQERVAKARRRSGLFSSAINFGAAIVTNPAAALPTLVDGIANLHAANAEIRAAKGIGELQRLSTELAAAERVEINEAYAIIRDAEFASIIKSRLRDVALLELDIERTANIAEQEHERLTSMMNQAIRLMTHIQNTNSNLADRYFADPIHAERLTKAMEKADASFKIAQNWMFYAAKALEYKWLVEFQHNGYTLNDILRARSITDLEDVLDSGMQSLDSNKTVANAFEQSQHTLSFKKDVFGYFDSINNVTQYYPHPAGDMTTDNHGNNIPVLLSSDEAFIEELKLRQEVLSSGNWVNIDFDTFKPSSTGNFFAGPEFNSNGCMAVGGTYLDKIETIGLNIPHYSFGGESTTNVYLTYGGISYIRNKEPGIATNNGDEGLVINEFTSFPVTFWDDDSNDFDQSLVIATKASLINDVNQESTTSLLKERSVAASGWNIRLQLDSDTTQYLDVNTIEDIELIVNHRYLNRNYSGNCQ